jgi:hypothetical protein
MPNAKRKKNRSITPDTHDKLDPLEWVPISAAFKRYRKRRFDLEFAAASARGSQISSEEAAVIDRNIQCDFAYLLATPSLPTIAVNCGTGAWYPIPPEWLQDCSVPRRLFLGDGQVPNLDQGGLGAYSGCLVMVDQWKLSNILENADLDVSVLAENRMLWRLHRKRGRKHGSGPHVAPDKDAVKEMRELILSGKAATRHAAARQMTPKVEGQSDDAKVKRLTNRYNKAYPGG